VIGKSGKKSEKNIPKEIKIIWVNVIETFPKNTLFHHIPLFFVFF
jgi:hypothetical protein